MRSGTLTACLLGVAVVLLVPAVGSGQARGRSCSLRHRIPAPAERQILRRFVQLRHAPAGPVGGRVAWIRCGATVTAIVPIEPPPTRRRHCADPDRPNLCLPYQDDSVWRRRGRGPWQLRGGFLACEEFPPAERERFFDAGICAELERPARQATSAKRPAPRAAARSIPGLRLSPQGLGPVRLGMDAAQAERSLGAPIAVEDGINGCGFWTLPSQPPGTQLIAFDGRLGYVILFERGAATTRGVRVGDGIRRLRHRYRGKLHRGRSASLSGADRRLFVTARRGTARYELEFDLHRGRVAFISAATRHTIETFGECA
jgi:hypothetical protein